MENYNNIIESEYGNIVYSGPINSQITSNPNQIENSISEETSILHNSDEVKDNEYTRESIITNTLPTQLVTYEHHLPEQITQEAIVHENNENISEEMQDDVSTIPNEENTIIEEVNPVETPIQFEENIVDPVTNNYEDENIPKDSSILDEHPMVHHEIVPEDVDDHLENEDVKDDENPLQDDKSQENLDLEANELNHIDEKTDDLNDNKEIGQNVESTLENIKNEEVEVSQQPENKIDLQQCRICLSKDNLVDIFQTDNNQRLCDMIMKICSIRIIKNDHLPQLVCQSCVEKVKIANELKTECEQTDKELRKNLKRSKNKIRRPTEFVLIDCEEFSESNNEEDDDEFHLSESISEIGSSDSSYSNTKKRRSSRPKRRSSKRKPEKRKSTSTGSRRSARKGQRNQSPEKKRIKQDVLYIEANDSVSENEKVQDKVKRRSNNSKKQFFDDGAEKKRGDRGHTCNVCEKVYSTQAILRDHKRTHSVEKSLTCQICNKNFKQLSNFNTHIQNHKKDEDKNCKYCHKMFTNKTDMQRHVQAVHESEQPIYVCGKCKEPFPTKARLDRHFQTKCSRNSTPQSASNGRKAKPEVDTSGCGRDLFKCVAPLTTTYWSDSFSE